MANAVRTQKLIDTHNRTVWLFTGTFDGSGEEAATNKINVAALSFARANTTPRLLRLEYLEWSVTTANTPAHVNLHWEANTNVVFATVAGTGRLGGHTEAKPYIIINTAGAGVSGNVGLSTAGLNVNNASYMIIASFRKDPAGFEQGATQDPKAFNA